MSIATKLADPFVRRALSGRRPTHLGRSLMLLTVRGRTSRREYTFPVQYARDGRSIWVFPGRPDTKSWWRNLRRPAEVRLHVHGDDLVGTGRAISGADEPDEVAQGLTTYVSRFPATARSIGVPRDAPPEAIRRQAEGIVMVRIDLAGTTEPNADR